MEKIFNIEYYSKPQEHYNNPETYSTNDLPHRWAIDNELKLVFNKINNPLKNVLDIGCSDGYTMLKLLKSFNVVDVSGVTFNKGEIDSANYEIKLKIKLGDMHSEGTFFGVNKFDLVWCRHVLEHSIAPYMLLNIMVQQLIVGGYLFIVLPPYPAGCEGDCHFSNLTDIQLYSLTKKLRLHLKEGFNFDSDRCFLFIKLG